MNAAPEPDVIEVEHESQALQVLPADVSDALVLKRDPSDVLAEATKAAKALMAVMAQKPDKVVMNGRQYIENDDWQTVGHFYGVTPKIEGDRFVTFGDVQGWEATAVALTRDGREIGRASAMCLNDEDKWSARAKYEYHYCHGDESDHGTHAHSAEEPAKLVWEPNPNKPGKNRPRKHRMRVGDEKVPMFQLRSMAQTRASSKVLRMVLGFVPVLAGFGATPAEELPDAERVPNQGYTVTPQSAPLKGASYGTSQAPPPTSPTEVREDGQLRIMRLDSAPTKNPNVIRYRVTLSTGEVVTTINQRLAALCEELCQDRAPVTVDCEQTRWGMDLKGVRRLNDDLPDIQIHDDVEPLKDSDIAF